MLTEKDYCDYETCVALSELDSKMGLRFELAGTISLYEAQKWLREKKGIHIAPRIYLYHDINFDDETSWECNIYIEYAQIYTIGKSLSYEDALLLGIKDVIKFIKQKEQERKERLELENTEFDYGHNVNHKSNE